MQVWSTQSASGWWAVVVLKEFAAAAPQADVVNGLHRLLPEANYLFADETPHGPLYGYVFVSEASDDRIGRLSRSGFVEHIVRTGNVLSKVTDAEVCRLLSVSRRLSAGQVVEIVAGDYTGLQARVVKVRGGRVQLVVPLRSGDYSIRLNAHDVAVVKS